MKHIRITTGILAGIEVKVTQETSSTVTGQLDNGATITLPKHSPIGMTYFEEVNHEAPTH